MRSQTSQRDSDISLLALLASPNIASRRPLFEQYDAIVQSRTVRRPEQADAAVLALADGSALAVNWAREHANAIIESWYAGEEGGTAIAETLSGKNNPAGRLPVTFYTGVEQLPPFEDYAMKGRTYRYSRASHFIHLDMA